MTRALLTLTARQLLGRRRSVFILLLALIPILVAAVYRLGSDQMNPLPIEFAAGMLDALVIAAVLPIAVMALATAAFGNEVEDRTLSLLAMKPISRMAIVLPKVAATVLVAGPIVVIAAVVVAALAVDEAPARAATAAGVGALVGVAAYTALFTWAGLVSNKALGFALVYVLLWEGLMASLISGVRYLSIRGYTIGIMHGLNEEGLAAFSSRAIELPAALIGAAVVTVVFVYLTVRRLGEMDIP